MTTPPKGEPRAATPPFRAVALVLVLCLLCSLAGCHGARDQQPFAIPDQLDTSRQFELTFWAKNDTNLTQVAIYKKAIADFEALYPNIKVTMKLYTDYGRIYNDVITNISTGTTPNICISYPDHIATYMEGENIVVPLDDLMVHPQYGLGGSALKFDSPTKDQMVKKFLDEGKIGDFQYALPFMRSTEACYVNKTFVEKLGYTLPEQLTWEFIWEVSEKAMEKDANGLFKVNGQKVLVPFIYKSTDNMMIQMLRQKGAGYSTTGGQIDLFNPTTRQLLQEIAVHAETRAFSTFKVVSYPADFLNAGQCLFAIDSTAGATWMGSDAPNLDISEDKLVKFETAVREIPQYDWSSPQMISQGPSLCLFNKEDPQEVLASWLFAQFLLTDSVQITYSQTEGYVPVTQKAQDTQQYRDYLAAKGSDNDLHYNVKLEATELTLRNIGNTFVTPVFNGSAGLRNAAGELVENIVKGAWRKLDMDDAYMDKLFADVTALYHLDEIAQVPGGDLGPLPQTSVILLSSICLCWVLMAVGLVISTIKKNKLLKGRK